MKKSAVKEQPPRIETLASELDKLFERNYRHCDHEREIADIIEDDVRALLERFGLLSMVNESFSTQSKCRFCEGTEWQIVHKPWCIEAIK